jgi:hypothetical protein
MAVFRNTLCGMGVLMLMLAGCGPGTGEQEPAPTIQVLLTQAAVPPTDAPTLTVRTRSTLTARATLMTRSTLTAQPTLIARATLTAQPTAVATGKPEQVLEQRLMAAYDALEGVTNVHLVRVAIEADGSALVRAEVIVAPGQVTEMMADRLRQETYAVLASATVDFSALLYNEAEASDFVWDNGDAAWQVMVLPSPAELDATMEAMTGGE